MVLNAALWIAFATPLRSVPCLGASVELTGPQICGKAFSLVALFSNGKRFVGK